MKAPHRIPFPLLLLLLLLLAACKSAPPASPTLLSPTPLPPSALPPSLTATQPLATLTLIPPSPTTDPTPIPPTPLAASPVPSLAPSPTGMPLLRYPAHELPLSLAWSPDGKLLAVAAGVNIHLVEAPALAEVGLLRAATFAGSLAFSPDGNLLALGGKDGSLQLWDPSTAQQLCRFQAHHPALKSLSFSADGKWLASTGNDAYVRLWDISTLPPFETCDLAPVAEMIGGVHSVPAAAFSPDGKVIASVDGGAILVREVATQRLVNTIQVGAVIFSLAYGPDGSWVVSGELGNGLHLWDVASGEALQALPLRGEKNDYEASLAVRASDGLLAVGSSDGRLTLWDTASGKLAATLPGHTRAVTGVAFSPDGRWLASTGLDAALRLWPVNIP